MSYVVMESQADLQSHLLNFGMWEEAKTKEEFWVSMALIGRPEGSKQQEEIKLQVADFFFFFFAFLLKFCVVVTTPGATWT